MRWLFLKDLQILRRSPLVLGLLLVYSVVLALVVSQAVDRGPSKPRIAVVNEIPPDAATFDLGPEKINVNQVAEELFQSIDPVRAKTRAEGLAKVKSGEALGMLVVPADIPQKLAAAIGLAGGDPPSVEFYYEGDNPLKSTQVQSAIKSRVADANRAISQKITGEAGKYLGYILHGGSFSLLGQSFDVLGLENAERIVRAVEATMPAADRNRAALDRVANFAKLAAENLDLSNELLNSIGAPIRVNEHVLSSSGNAFYSAAAVAVSLMFVCVLLGAGLLALEREEHAFGRLVRGLVSRTTIVGQKTLLAGLLGAVAGAVILAVLTATGNAQASDLPGGIVAVIVAAIAFGALGVAIGGVAREVRAASLLAVLVLLPVAVLGLIPNGTVTGAADDAITAISAVFPFRPALRGIEAGLTGGDLLGRLGHLALLALGYGVLARLALRRFA
ncbi:MAG: transporter permease [Solirubrobacterales bacterium]|nr:transporter permease [Solirubrobacterales bacterium]